jgi:putative ABC transport system permease protein
MAFWGGANIGDAATLLALGGEEAREAFLAGAIVLFHDGGAQGRDLTLVEPDGTRHERLPYAVVPAVVPYGSVPTVLIPEPTAARLGLEAEPVESFVIRLPRAVTDADAAAAGALIGETEATVIIERGPGRSGDAFRLLLVLASLAFALATTGIAVALGEAEARPDQRALLALGADPSVRRRITAARAGVLAAIAGSLAVPAGLLPVWGLLLPRGTPIVAPLLEIAAAMVVLPLAAVLGAALLSRPLGPWSAYRTATR